MKTRLLNLIEELKAADQKANGMFELGEDIMCELVDVLVSMDAEPVAHVLAEGFSSDDRSNIITGRLPVDTALYTAPPAPDDIKQSIEALAKLNNQLYRWTSRMSYNDSWVGEPEGLIKKHIREMEHILDACRAMLNGGKS